MRTIVARKYKILACSGEPRIDVVNTLQEWGVNFFHVHINRTGMRPWEDLRIWWELYRLMTSYRPDVVLSYTIKPVIWSGFAAKMAGISGVYSLITGTGYTFTAGKSLRNQVARLFAFLLYKFSLKHSRRVLFQNQDNLNEFLKFGLVKKEQCLLVNGSGVDLNHYCFASLPKKPNFLMICRLIIDKGVREYINAAKLIKKHYKGIKFRLVGPLDSHPSSVSQKELEKWKREGVINYLGELEDVRPAYADCSIYVLPSYNEGIPRTILEAMSMGRPIITTNTPGCRETIRMPANKKLDKASKDIILGENGFLVPKKNVEKLVQAMEYFIMKPELIQIMGFRSRVFAEEKFDVHKVNQVMLQAMDIE